MAETTTAVAVTGLGRRRGRMAQIQIYLGKFFLMFIYQSDWKVLPMSAVIGGLVGLVIQPTTFVTMEGTVFGAFARSCACIWNGCFNSIQVVCRERGIVKREHRSGMHISAYVAAHMIYQAFLCLLQTALLVVVCRQLGVHFPEKGFITGFFDLDFGITIFLVTYASDMLGLFVSSLVRTTTAAMTVMPFLLIFQLIFSGGFFTLPEWSRPLTDITVSRYGLRSVAALGNYNELPAVLAWNTLYGMKDTKVGTTLTVEDVTAVLQDETIRSTLRGVDNGMFTMEDVADAILDSGLLQQFEGEEYDLRIKIGDVIDAIGEDTVRHYVMEATRLASYKADYRQSYANVGACWLVLGGMALLFAAAAMISLEFIDKDKR